MGSRWRYDRELKVESVRLITEGRKNNYPKVLFK